MSAASRVGALGLGLAAGATAAGKEEWFQPFLAAGKAALAALPAAQISPSAGVDSSAQLAALSASVKTLSAAVEGAMRAQSSGPSASAILLVGAPLAGAFYYFRGLGWVTLSQLKEGLAGVQQAVCKSLAGIKEQLLERIGLIEVKLEESAAWRQEQSTAMDKLSAEVHEVHETVGGLERRIDVMEKDVSRSARGVELLCEFVASANAPSTPGDTLQDRLSSFTGITQRAPPANPALPPTWASPAGGSTGSIIAAAVSGRSAPAAP